MLTKSDIQKQALSLPPRERIDLVVELWNGLASEEIPVPEWQRVLMRDRLAEIEHLDPEERSVPWEVVRKQVFADRS